MADAGSKSPHLEGAEQEQAALHAALPARVVHEIVRNEGEEEIARDAGQLAWSGLAAGLSMGFSFFVQALVRSALPVAPWSRLNDALGYTVGFVLVVLGRQQLFTESTLTAVLPVLTTRTLASVLRMLRLWGWVLGTNLVGTWLFAAMLRFGRPFEPEVAPARAARADRTVSSSFGGTALGAVLSGWLLALMVWLLPSTRSARLFAVMLITYVVALAQVSHVVAGSVEAAYAVLIGHAGVRDYCWRFLTPTLIGNTIGGVVFVALLNHAPVSSDLREERGEQAAGT